MLVIFACSYFYYGNNHGGLWNLSNCAALGLYAFASPWWKRNTNLPLLSKILLWGVFILNTLGLVLVADTPLAVRAEGFMLSLSYGLLYLFIVQLPANKVFFQRLLLVVAALSVWNMIIALNQKLMLVSVSSPLLPAGYEENLENNGWENYEHKSERSNGSFNDFELFAEYSSLILALVLPLVIRQISEYFMVHKRVLIVTALCCFLSIIATATRSSALLTVPLMLFYLVYYSPYLGRRPAFLMYLGAFVLVIILAGPYIGLDFIIERLVEIDFDQLGSGSMASADAMNREVTLKLGLKRLGESDWILGYGYGVAEHYTMALFGFVNTETNEIRDFHNLYLSLPVMLGWGGAILFVGWMLYHPVYLWQTLRQTSDPDLRALYLGLLMFWGVFFVNELKIQAIREPNYFMLIWCWLGFTISACQLNRNAQIHLVAHEELEDTVVSLD
ncbi:O-antigen ligase family protein [Spirosoma taeanense]|uniref:O-antigen ligase family protein n=1 Tax=Spirosoma taeanense TaxID=2735870 RepID=A0A6M5XZL3_9BACT|nr:O-antigen ligase family protein [Spirosoma taeanense]QJW87998.1 O-antigen ligase family protein [Spirosoma taeanense]